MLVSGLEMKREELAWLTRVRNTVSYDWHKGHQYANPPNTPNKIFLHATKDDEVKRRPKKA